MIQDALNGLLCTKVDNSAVKGVFFDDPGYPLASLAFSSPFGRAAVKTNDYNSYRRSTVGEQQNSEFQVGDTIPFIIQRSFSDPQNGGTYFSQDVLRLPFASANGICNYLNIVQFGKDISTNGECKVPILSEDELHSYCRNEFNIERYLARSATFRE